MNDRIVQLKLNRKDMLTLALLLRPGQDYSVFGPWEDPQLVMDLSQDELAYGQMALELLRPAIEATTEQELAKLLGAKLQLHGDAVSRMFGALGNAIDEG